MDIFIINKLNKAHKQNPHLALNFKQWKIGGMVLQSRWYHMKKKDLITIGGCYLKFSQPIVCTTPTTTPPAPLSAGGSWTSYQIFKERGLDRALIFRGGLVRKRGVTFLRGEGGSCNFYVKNKLKSEIFNGKKYW